METLQKIVQENPFLVFRGGTSLSKAYHAINRFSEDLDLSVIVPPGFEEKRATREDYEALLLLPVERGIKAMKFSRPYEFQETSSVKYYCLFQKTDHSLFAPAFGFETRLKIESTLLSRPFPLQKMSISSYIYSFLEAEGHSVIANQYGLSSFPLNVQDIARTAVDKMCAICDYYLEKKSRRNSRHLYDLYQISFQADYASSEFRDLARKVYEERIPMERAYSANEGVSMNGLFHAIVKNHFLRRRLQPNHQVACFFWVFRSLRENRRPFMENFEVKPFSLKEKRERLLLTEKMRICFLISLFKNWTICSKRPRDFPEKSLFGGEKA